MDIEVNRLEQFAWLLDNDNDRRPEKLLVLWSWADEMAYLQKDANETGKPVEYYQRGKVLRTLHPSRADADDGPH